MAEGFMSVAYHICPGKTNYQFDTTFMFVLAGLGIFKLLESRSPDLHPGLHKLLVLLAAIILLVVVGVVSNSVQVFSEGGESGKCTIKPEDSQNTSRDPQRYGTPPPPPQIKK